MNDIEKVIKYFKMRIVIVDEEREKLYKIAIQALEKQITKKVDDSWMKMPFNQNYLCPSCKGILDKQQYCHSCGQKLDWSVKE
jgi:hypothetical protein